MSNNANAVPAVKANGSNVPAVDLAAIMAQLEALKARNAELEQQAANRKGGKLSFTVTDGTGNQKSVGALMISGFGKFPVTLYYEQFQRLRAQWDECCAFVDKARKEGKMTTKEEKAAATVPTIK